MKEPTEAQVKELWEWCDKYTYWTYENGWDNFPKITLNNLFKYAVPRIDTVSVFLSITSDGWGCFINYIQEDIHERRFYKQTQAQYNKDPALALFWAIHKVIKESK